MKQFEITDLPVRTAKFIVRKQWVVAGSDDMFVTVHNFNTMEKVKRFEAHSDYIRSIAVHPTLPIVLTSSDDMLIKLWDWDKGWLNTQIFQVHAHYVMMCRVIVSGVAVHVIYIIQIYNWAFTFIRYGAEAASYISFF